MTTAAKGSSTEIVTLDDAQVEQVLRGELAAQDVQVMVQDPAQVQLDIIRRILDSESAEEVLGGRKPIGLKDCLGRAFSLNAVRWHKSAYDEGGLPVFAVLDITFLDDGESAVATTGSANVMAQAYRLAQIGLPVDVKAEEAAVPTAAGYRPQYLTAA